MISQIIGVWIAAGLTLCIFSFLYKDNPFYKFAEHIYVGSSAAYMFITFYFFDLKPMVIDRFRLETGTSRFILIIPLLFGIMMVLRLIPKISWISRWAIAFTFGIGSGIGIVAGVHGYLLPQIKGTLLPFIVLGDAKTSINNTLIIIGVITTFLYFFFSKEHKGGFRIPVRIGMYFIMISFGASFGYTVMARLSLLIGRIHFLLYNWLHIIK